MVVYCICFYFFKFFLIFFFGSMFLYTFVYVAFFILPFFFSNSLLYACFISPFHFPLLSSSPSFFHSFSIYLLPIPLFSSFLLRSSIYRVPFLIVTPVALSHSPFITILFYLILLSSSSLPSLPPHPQPLQTNYFFPLHIQHNFPSHPSFHTS